MAPALTYPLPDVHKKRRVKWKSTEDLVQSPRRRLQHVSKSFYNYVSGPSLAMVLMVLKIWLFYTHVFCQILYLHSFTALSYT